MRISTIIVAGSLVALPAGPILAAENSATPENSAKPAKEAEKMKSDDKAGSTPNSSIPGANPAADGNATQDSRTTKTKDR